MHLLCVLSIIFFLFSRQKTELKYWTSSNSLLEYLNFSYLIYSVSRTHRNQLERKSNNKNNKGSFRVVFAYIPISDLHNAQYAIKLYLPTKICRYANTMNIFYCDECVSNCELFLPFMIQFFSLSFQFFDFFPVVFFFRSSFNLQRCVKRWLKHETLPFINGTKTIFRSSQDTH